MASAVVSVMIAGAALVFFLLLVEDSEVLGVFQHEARRLPQGIGGQLFDAQGIQGGGPIQTFCDGGLLQNGLVAAQLGDSQGHLVAQPVIHMGQLGPDDGQFLLNGGILDIQIGTTAPQRISLVTKLKCASKDSVVGRPFSSYSGASRHTVWPAALNSGLSTSF